MIATRRSSPLTALATSLRSVVRAYSSHRRLEVRREREAEAMKLEVIEIATGKVVHSVPCDGETPGTRAFERLKMGVLNNIGRFDCRLSRGGNEFVDDRLGLDRFFLREAGS